MSKIELPLPPHYDPKNSTDPYYRPSAARLERAALEWRNVHGLRPIGSHQGQITLLVIDNQVDFCFPLPVGALYVGGRSGTGGMDDLDRLTRFIYRHLSFLTSIICTLDTHLPHQVFHPIAHISVATGLPPDPHTVISAADYRAGKYRANPAMARQIGVNEAWLQRQFIHYCEALEKSGRYQLTIWPYHCMLGEMGHLLAGVMQEARLFHGFAVGAQNTPQIKGGNPLTENYSVFRPEVMTTWDGNPIPGAQRNAKLIEELMKSSMVVFAGQAASHCVAWSVADFLSEIVAIDPALASKMFILRDCTSPVVVPGVVDYTAQAEEAFARFADAGINLVNSTDPIASWPGADRILAKVV